MSALSDVCTIISIQLWKSQWFQYKWVHQVSRPSESPSSECMSTHNCMPLSHKYSKWVHSVTFTQWIQCKWLHQVRARRRIIPSPFYTMNPLVFVIPWKWVMQHTHTDTHTLFLGNEWCNTPTQTHTHYSLEMSDATHPHRHTHIIHS